MAVMEVEGREPARRNRGVWQPSGRIRKSPISVTYGRKRTFEFGQCLMSAPANSAAVPSPETARRNRPFVHLPGLSHERP